MKSCRRFISTGLTITNPLVLYRSLLAGKQIAPDPSQHRLALHLQTLYFRLKDYEPRIEYEKQLQQISRAINASGSGTSPANAAHQDPSGHGNAPSKSLWSSLLARKEKRDALALTRVLTSHEAAIELDSPQGLLLHGDVGTGKSMLVDLLADCLPNKMKRRWHFNAFMLEILHRLESFRRSQNHSLVPPAAAAPAIVEDDYSLLWLAKDLVSTSPILFLDEFQLPDRTASKILSNLLTSFFHLGGVLVATSNRMPDELAKASGIEFAPPPPRQGSFASRWGQRQPRRERSQGMFSGQSEFADFLEVLKARCEVWDMEGSRDWRRRDVELDENANLSSSSSEMQPTSGSFTDQPLNQADNSNTTSSEAQGEDCTSAATPTCYRTYSSSDNNSGGGAHTRSRDSDFESLVTSVISSLSPPETPFPISSSSLSSSIPWQPAELQVYGRRVQVPRAYGESSRWTFSELCGASFGPADYITLASTYRVIVLTDVPVLTLSLKNEARRFITLLDALYESRCRLVVHAAAPPDALFFPTPSSSSTLAAASPSPTRSTAEDPILAETYASVHRDLTSPFRPNTAVYAPTHADEDADFNPSNPSTFPARPTTMSSSQSEPDFSLSSALTGTDERFAYRRAESRLFEMCGDRWARTRVWRPLPLELRRWERRATSEISHSSESLRHRQLPLGSANDGEAVVAAGGIGQTSPFRTSTEPPPKFAWVHAWGMMRWGKKAGRWGMGVDAFVPDSTATATATTTSTSTSPVAAAAAAAAAATPASSAADSASGSANDNMSVGVDVAKAMKSREQRQR